MLEKLAAVGEEVGAGGGAADAVQEVARRFHPEADEVQELFHVVDLAALGQPGRADGFVKSVDVGEDVAAGRAEDRDATALFPDLAEEPGIADDAAADHESARIR